MVRIAPDSGNRAAHLGVLAVYLFGAAAFVSSAASNVALGLLVLALLLDRRRAWPVLRRDPALLLFAAFACYLAVGLLWVWLGEARAADLDGARRLLKLWLFLPLAYWLGGSRERIERFLLCVVAGFIVGRLLAVDWLGPPALVTGERLRLGISSINHFGQYAATLSLGTLIYAGAVWHAAARYSPQAAFLLRGGWVLIGVTSLYWMLASQSRGALAALLGAIVFAGAFAGCHRRPGITRGNLLALVVASAAAVLMAVLAGGGVAQRVAEESATLTAALTGRWEDLPFDPIGIRLHMVRLGVEWWLDRPWFGWGPGAVEGLLDGAAPALHQFKHLHNTPIDNLVRLGALGALLLQGLFVYIAASLWRLTASGGVPFRLGLFLLSAMTLAFLFGQTDYRMGAWDWRHYWIFLGGAAYALPLARRESRLDSPT